MRRTGTDRSFGPLAGAIASVVVLSVVAACQEDGPMALDEGSLPAEPLTVQIELPWSEFGSNLQVLGGFSTPAIVGTPVVAHGYKGALEARSLVRFDPLPPAIRVQEGGDGVVVTDTNMTYIGGFLTLGFDTLTSVTSGPTGVELGAIQEEWEANTASWTLAVDTIGGQQAWTEPGGGAVVKTSTATWTPSASDSVTIVLDSAFLDTWADSTDMRRGGRLASTTDGTLLVLTRMRFRVSMRSSLADTIVEDTVDLMERTIVYDPTPAAPTDIRVGGAPAWRTLMTVATPALTGPPELCAAVGCPFTPEAGQLSYAALSLTTQASEPAFQPVDTLRIDARPVLDTQTLPKAPLGSSQTGGGGEPIAPAAFGSAPGESVRIPMTAFMRTLLSGPDSEGRDPPSVLALIAASEPASLSFASFVGPGGAGEPTLTMIVTVSDPQVLP